ncbi:MAG: DUF5053 domain-containing protein [Candidatus Azobacteroides sp.]|nr:DUF5053 domain-containing protein [Candidatus Azobacteroides sp.]
MKDFNNEIEQLLAIGRGMSDTEFDQLLDDYFGDKTDVEKEQIGVAVLETKISKFNEIIQIDNEIKFIEQLDGLEKYLNMAQLSKDFFGKQKTWLYNRLHGWNVHGKPAKFTDTERKQFANMLLSLSDNMKNVALKLV